MFVRLIGISGVVLALFLTGCATTVSNSIKPTAANVAKYNDMSDLNVVATLEKSVNEAKSINMPFLAPNYFREASKVLSECQNALGNKHRDELANNAARGDVILEKGRAVMAIVLYRFAKELEFKAQLEEHNAQKLLPKEYEKVIGDLSRLIEKVEREQADNIENEKDALQKAMLDLVIMAVQEEVLRESEVINADSKKKNADKQVPLTYTEALRVYQDAKNQIAAAHHDRKLVQSLGAKALFAARHAQQVNDRVALLQTQLKASSSGIPAPGATTASLAGTQISTQHDGKTSATERFTVEKIVLQEEDRLLGISSALGLKDLRDQAVEKQVEEIKQSAGEVARQPKNQASTAAMREMEARLQAAEGTTQQVMAELVAKKRELAAATQQMTLAQQQLTSATQQLEVQATQLAQKDEQIKALSEKAAQVEGAAKTIEKPKTAKPKASKPKVPKSKDATPKKNDSELLPDQGCQRSGQPWVASMRPMVFPKKRCLCGT